MATQDYVTDLDSERGWSRYLTWPVLLSVGWLIYELTHKPALGAMAVCVKFGLNDFLTARWLSRIDTHRGRGHTCFWLYLASGLYKTAITGSVLALSITLFAAVMRPRPPVFRVQPQILDWQGLKEAFVGAALTTLCGFLLSVLISLLALAWAKRHQVKMWLDREVHQARRDNVWPSCPPATGRVNRAELPIVVALLFALGFLSVAALLVALFVLRDVRGWSFLCALIAAMVVFAMGLRMILTRGERARRELFARNPAECWGVPEYDDI